MLGGECLGPLLPLLETSRKCLGLGQMAPDAGRANPNSRSKRQKRQGVQLPDREIMWGFQFRNGYYTKLVATVRTNESPCAPNALEQFGHEMTFVGELSPQIQSVLDLSGGGMSGHRNFSRIPLADLSTFSSMLESGSVRFVVHEGEVEKVWTVDQLESVFGPCPARSSPSVLNKTTCL